MCNVIQDPTLTSILDSVRVLVLDEADNLLDMGFRWEGATRLSV